MPRTCIWKGQMEREQNLKLSRDDTYAMRGKKSNKYSQVHTEALWKRGRMDVEWFQLFMQPHPQTTGEVAAHSLRSCSYFLCCQQLLPWFTHCQVPVKAERLLMVLDTSDRGKNISKGTGGLITSESDPLRKWTSATGPPLSWWKWNTKTKAHSCVCSVEMSL